MSASGIDLPTSEAPVVIIKGDCLDVLQELPENSVDSFVGDVPYGLEFMGKDWDAPWKSAADGFRRAANPEDAGRDSPFGRLSKRAPEFKAGLPYAEWCLEWARLAIRVLKPGANIVCFGGSRTYHWLGAALELGGSEIRDSLHWMYGQAMPKGANLGRQLDMLKCAETGRHNDKNLPKKQREGDHLCVAMPEHDHLRDVRSNLKPAHEPIVLARKPLDGNLAENFAKWGVGGLNIGGCRLGEPPRTTHATGNIRGVAAHEGGFSVEGIEKGADGRYPPNVLLTHSPGCERIGTRTAGSGAKKIGGKPRTNVGHKLSAQNADRSKATMNYGEEEIAAYDCAADCPVAALDRQSGVLKSGLMKAGTQRAPRQSASMGEEHGALLEQDTYADEGGASRFFPTFEWDPTVDVPFLYCAKTSRSEKEAGLGDLAQTHPTVKPVALMQWLCRLVTPPGGIILDPFLGCYDAGTRVLTHRGFVPWPEVNRKDEFAARSKDGRMSFQRATALQAYSYRGPMHHYFGRSLDLLVTPNHRMLVREHHEQETGLVKSEEMSKRWYAIPNSAKWRGARTVSVKLGGHVIDPAVWFRFVGLYIAEGSIAWAGRGYGVHVKQSKSRAAIKAVRGVLAALGFGGLKEYRTCGTASSKAGRLFTLRDAALHAFCREIGRQPVRRISRAMLDADLPLLQALFEGLMLGDGCAQDGRSSYYTCSAGLADDVAELMVKLGYATTIHRRERGPYRARNGRMIIARYPEHMVSARYAKETKIDTHQRKKTVPYDGMVYCATVPPHHTLLVERNGKIAWCGNSGTTAIAAVREGFRCIGIEKDEEGQYIEIAQRRINHELGGE
mgnify:CR=1 FL=1